MKVKTFQKEYELVEFHHYTNQFNKGSCISVVELLLDVDSPDLDYIEQDFTNMFAVETDKHVYIFSNYEVDEYYITDEGYVKIVCTR